MPTLTCETCDTGFFQATGRPAKYCTDCRERRRYGNAHQKLRSATVDLAVGKPCARCGELIRSVDAVDLDHHDSGEGYLGYSHARCNRSAGTTRNNAARAAAYRAAKGQSSSNGSAVKVREPEAPRCQRTAAQIDASAAAGDPLPCVCSRRNSRCW